MEGEFFGEADVEQVEAVAELDDGSDDGGAFDVAAFAPGLLCCPLEGAGGAVFPKVDAVAEPVVGVGAGERRDFPASTALATRLSQPWNPKTVRW